MVRHGKPGASGFSALAESDGSEEDDGEVLPAGSLRNAMVPLDEPPTGPEERECEDVQDVEEEEEEEESSNDEEACDGRLGAPLQREALRGRDLEIFRSERGIEVSPLTKRHSTDDQDWDEGTPVLEFEDLRQLGVSADLVSACRRCAKGSPLATSVQSECWGLLLERRPNGRAPELPTGEAIGGDVAALAAEQLFAAASLAVPNSLSDDEDFLEDPTFCPSTSSSCRVREGRDFVGIAPTGSGKTMAYLVPLLADGLCKVRCRPSLQREQAFERFQELFKKSFPPGKGSNAAVLERLAKLRSGSQAEFVKALRAAGKLAHKDKALSGKWQDLLEDLDALGLLRPSALVLAPTRELAQQVGDVAKVLGAASTVVLGGVDHERQRERLRVERPSLIVASPGRLRALCGQRPASATARLRLAESAAVAGSAPAEESAALPEALLQLRTVRRLVLDEGDRLLDEGFEEDILALAALCSRRNLSMLFSATWTSQTEAFAVLLRSNAIKVSVAGIPLVITQEVELIPKSSRARRLRDLLREFGSGAKVLVFVLFRREAKSIAKMLTEDGIPAFALAGNMSQAARTFTMQAFRQARTCDKGYGSLTAAAAALPTVLVATDVAARGLDVPDVTHVVNFSLGLSIDGYVHRIGRCGRAGREGTAVTFVTDGDERFAGPLLKLLQQARQAIPPGLAEMAKGFEKSGGSARYSVRSSNAGGEVKLVAKGQRG